jgi:hypothetical protein
MTRDFAAANRRIHQLYDRDHAALGEAGALRLLDRARRWDLAATLRAGGVVVFPHATVHDCGHQIAAAVNAALDSGADRVIVISVLHAWTPEMEEARQRLAAGHDLTGHPLRAIQGPTIPGERQEWQLDHALISWRYLWDIACRSRGVRGPEVIELYPFLTGATPETLPGYEEAARLAENAVIVSTADPFHHGIGYGDGPDTARAPDEGGLALAAASIAESIRLLATGDYRTYLNHCVQARNDARDAGPLFHHLRRPRPGRMLEIVASDMTELYQSPPPTWVAGALVTWEPA